jgi:hypothetical protein
MLRKEVVILFCFGLFVVLVAFIRRKQHEGFQDAKISPQVATYELLTSVMGPIRRLSSIITNPSNWKDRINMARMSPTELARMHLQSQQKVE